MSTSELAEREGREGDESERNGGDARPAADESG